MNGLSRSLHDAINLDLVVTRDRLRFDFLYPILFCLILTRALKRRLHLFLFSSSFLASGILVRDRRPRYVPCRQLDRIGQVPDLF
jgi:hypothetical protein